MAMTIAGMAAAIEAQFLVPVSTPAQYALAMATAIIGYIQSNAVVDPAGTPTPLTAPAGGGPVTGAGKVD